jgi:hypothetical protein
MAWDTVMRIGYYLEDMADKIEQDCNLDQDNRNKVAEIMNDLLVIDDFVSNTVKVYQWAADMSRPAFRVCGDADLFHAWLQEEARMEHSQSDANRFLNNFVNALDFSISMQLDNRLDIQLEARINRIAFGDYGQI